MVIKENVMGGFRCVMGVTPIQSSHGWPPMGPQCQAEGLAKQLQVIDSSIQVRWMGCFMGKSQEFQWVSMSFNEFQWVSCGFMAFHLTYLMRNSLLDGVWWCKIVLKESFSKHVKHQMPAQDWDRQPEVDLAQLMSPQTSSCKVDDSWIYRWFMDD